MPENQITEEINVVEFDIPPQAPGRKLTVYEPDRAIKVGFVAQWQEMVRDLVESRELIWRLFLRDFRAKYRQSMLGIAWAVINPMIAVGLFVYLNSAGLLHIGDTGVPYVAFAVVGLTIWNLFAIGLSTGTNSIVSAGSMVTKINFPRISLVLSALGQSIVEFGVRLVLCAVILIGFKVVPAWTAIFLPLAIIPLFMFTTGLALMLSLVAGVIRDVASIITLAVTFLMFLVPVLYPVPEAGMGAKLFAVNPLAQLVVGPRDLVFNGSLSSPTGFIWSSVLALVIFLVCWRLFHLSETKIAERI